MIQKLKEEKDRKNWEERNAELGKGIRMLLCGHFGRCRKGKTPMFHSCYFSKSLQELWGSPCVSVLQMMGLRFGLKWLFWNHTGTELGLGPGFPATCSLPPPPHFPSLSPLLGFFSDPDLSPHTSQAIWHPVKPHKHSRFTALMLQGAETELRNSPSLLIKKRFRPTLGSQFYLTATAFNCCCIFIVANVMHRSIFPVMLLSFCSICWRENICRNFSASLQGLKLQL